MAIMVTIVVRSITDGAQHGSGRCRSHTHFDKVLELEAQVAELQLKAACQDVLLQHMEEGFVYWSCWRTITAGP